jgi:hypothetical protein
MQERSRELKNGSIQTPSESCCDPCDIHRTLLFFQLGVCHRGPPCRVIQKQVMTPPMMMHVARSAEYVPECVEQFGWQGKRAKQQKVPVPSV